jgi:hypothetical protein
LRVLIIRTILQSLDARVKDTDMVTTTSLIEFLEAHHVVVAALVPQGLVVINKGLDGETEYEVLEATLTAVLYYLGY